MDEAATRWQPPAEQERGFSGAPNLQLRRPEPSGHAGSPAAAGLLPEAAQGHGGAGGSKQRFPAEVGRFWPARDKHPAGTRTLLLLLLPLHRPLPPPGHLTAFYGTQGHRARFKRCRGKGWGRTAFCHSGEHPPHLSKEVRINSFGSPSPPTLSHDVSKTTEKPLKAQAEAAEDSASCGHGKRPARSSRLSRSLMVPRLPVSVDMGPSPSLWASRSGSPWEGNADALWMMHQGESSRAPAAA